MKVLLLGSTGQVGSAFVELSQTEAFPIGWELISWSRTQGDLSNESELIGRIRTLKPDAIINAAAYTQVDLAEKETDLCFQINAKTPATLAEYAKQANIPLVHFSTDYVYAGDGELPHEESEVVAPINEYGKSKALGDQLISLSGCEHLIFRTSWVFSHVGKNFVKTMLRIGSSKPELQVVNDQIGAPTYAPDLATYALEALMRGLEQKALGYDFPTGIYHLTNSGETTWAGFAKAILPQTKITGISTAEYPTPAKRPLNSRLSLKKWKATFGVEPRLWQDALKVCLARLGEKL